MKKLRMWVKVALWILLIGFIVLLFNILNDITNKSIEICVECVNSYEWCVRELKK